MMGLGSVTPRQEEGIRKRVSLDVMLLELKAFFSNSLTSAATHYILQLCKQIDRNKLIYTVNRNHIHIRIMRETFYIDKKRITSTTLSISSHSFTLQECSAVIRNTFWS